MTGLFLGGFLAYGVGVYGYTQFLGPIQSEFGWGRAVLGGMMSAFWLAAPFVLIASYALDRIGIRALVISGAVIEAVALVWTTFLSHPAEFFLVRFLMGAGKCLVVTPLPIAVARWFPNRTGFGFAVALCGWHVGGLLLAPLAATLIADFGWRAAARILAAVLVAGMVLAALLMRDPQLGTAAPDSQHPRTSVPTANWAKPVALAALALGTIAFYAGYAALLSQLSPLLADIGLAPRGVGYASSVCWRVAL
jgi:MFS family permease